MKTVRYALQYERQMPSYLVAKCEESVDFLLQIAQLAKSGAPTERLTCAYDVLYHIPSLHAACIGRLLANCPDSSAALLVHMMTINDDTKALQQADNTFVRELCTLGEERPSGSFAY